MGRMKRREPQRRAMSSLTKGDSPEKLFDEKARRRAKLVEHPSGGVRRKIFIARSSKKKEVGGKITSDSPKKKGGRRWKKKTNTNKQKSKRRRSGLEKLWSSSSSFFLFPFLFFLAPPAPSFFNLFAPFLSRISLILSCLRSFLNSHVSRIRRPQITRSFR